MDNGFLVTRIKIEEFLRSQPLDTARDGLANKANYLNCEISKNEMHLVDPTKVAVDCLNNMNLPCVDTMMLCLEQQLTMEKISLGRKSERETQDLRGSTNCLRPWERVAVIIILIS